MSPTKPPSSAATRLKSVLSHIAPPPADYSDIISQKRRLESFATAPPVTQRSYQRQLSRGKLWVRDRITSLLDPESFYEIGATTGAITWDPKTGDPVDIIPSNNINGHGKIDGRKVWLTADDFAMRAGHADGALMEKTLYIEKMALEERAPILKLVDGSSGGGSVTVTMKLGYTPLPSLYNFFSLVQKQCDLGIPNIALVLGPAVGLGATRAAMAHISIIAADVGSFFAAGPSVVAHATFEEGLSNSDLGGAPLQTANGTLTLLAPSETAAFLLARRVLSYLPQCGATNLPPILSSSSPDYDVPTRTTRGIAANIPRRPARASNIPAIVSLLTDTSSPLELSPKYSMTASTHLVRFSGRPTALISNTNSLALDAAGCLKIARFLRLADVFNLPVVQLIDCPGFAVGSAAEREATMKAGVDMARAYYTTGVPILSVVVRRCYGVAGGIMVDPREAKERFFWPSAEFGSLPAEGGGIEVAHRGELEEVRKKEGEEAYKLRLEELVREYKLMENPLRAAGRFGVEEVVEPEKTRERVCEWVKECYEGRLSTRVEERRVGRRVTSFF